jgi:hypothetical protein
VTLLVILKYAAIVACGFGGSILYALIKGSRQPDIPLPELPPEIRAQIDGCRHCNLTERVCAQHPDKAFEACGCGGMIAPCPWCRPDLWNVPELVKQNLELKEARWW